MMHCVMRGVHVCKLDTHEFNWIKALMGDLFSFKVPVPIIPLLGQVFSLFS